MTGDQPSAAVGNQLSGAGSQVLDQPFDSSSLYQLRAATAACAQALGASPRLTNDIVLAVHELASNSVRHGPGQGRLCMWQDLATVICEVSENDRNGPVEPDAAARQPDPAWPVEHGHGLWLVRQVADQFAVHYSASGARTTITFAIRP
jgi:anti-sigma regulatory factor (Ser/Thr protein kinase)